MVSFSVDLQEEIEATSLQSFQLPVVSLVSI